MQKENNRNVAAQTWERRFRIGIGADNTQYAGDVSVRQKDIIAYEKEMAKIESVETVRLTYERKRGEILLVTARQQASKGKNFQKDIDDLSE